MEVIEFEGWLMKRGAGFKPNTRDRYGQGTSSMRSFTTSTTSGLSEKMRNSSKNLSSTFKRKFKGKLEKKRYFRLKKVMNPPAGILSYYTGKTSTKEHGRVLFNHLDEVRILDDFSIELSLPSRTYYLRPVGEDGDLDDKEREIIALQWLHSFQSIMKSVKEGMESPSTPVTFLRSPSDRSQNLSSSKKEALSTHASYASFQSEFVDENVPKRKLSESELANYADIWHKCGFEGFQKVVAHFGAVEVDITRLRRHIARSIEDLDERIKEFELQRITASEPVIKYQPTAYAAFYALYEQDKKTFQWVGLARSRLLKLLERFDKEMGECREKILKAKTNSKRQIESLKQRKNGMSKAHAKTELAKKAIEDFKSFADEKPNTNSVKMYSLLKRVKGKFKTEKKLPPEEELKQLEHELKSREEVEKQMTQSFYDCQEKCTKQMVVTLDQFQKIEEDRLTLQKKILKDFVEIELGHLQLLYSQYHREEENAGITVVQAADNINPTEDMKQTAIELREFAKETKREQQIKRNAQNNTLA